MHIGYHHYTKLRKSPKNQTRIQKKLDSVMDKIIYIFATVGVIIFLPQLITVWTEPDVSGVSVLSWEGMLIASSFWLVYGIIHKAKPIIYANGLAAIVQLLIVVGVLMHR